MLELVPVTYRDAARFVDAHHRHHRPPPGHKFSIGVATDDGILVGVAMIGRPVARHYDGCSGDLHRRRAAVRAARPASR